MEMNQVYLEGMLSGSTKMRCLKVHTKVLLDVESSVVVQAE